MNDIDVRLAKLERDLTNSRKAARRDRLILIGVALVAGALLIGGAGRSSEMPEELKTKQLTIADDNGIARAVLGTKPDGLVHLELRDATGKSRQVLRVNSKGEPSLNMGDGTSWLLAIEVNNDREPRVELRDRKDKNRLELVVGTDNLPRLLMRDSSEAIRALVGGKAATGPKEIDASESSFHMYNHKGELVWKAQ